MSGPADVWHEQVAQDEAKKEQKNKNFTTEKKKETIQAIKLHNQPTTMLDFGPHVASLRHQGPQAVSRMWQGFGAKSVCMLVCVWSGTVSSCSGTEHLLDAVRPGQTD